MIKKIIILTFLVFAISCNTENKKNENYNIIEKKEASKEISFYTKDSIQIVGDLYEINKSSAIILLFHQGGANARSEYASIIPELISLGYNVLSIDQRLGGQMFGSFNRTVSNIGYKNFSFNGYTYCDAYPDLEGALKFVEDLGFTGDKILWGSSYSATLSIKLAGNYSGQIKGVLAFSPASGKPMKDCQPEDYFSNLKGVPLLILKPPSEAQSENAKKQIELARQLGHKVYIAENGVHGSSMLVKNRVNKSVDDNWRTVKSFLKKIKK